MIRASLSLCFAWADREKEKWARRGRTAEVEGKKGRGGKADEKHGWAGRGFKCATRCGVGRSLIAPGQLFRPFGGHFPSVMDALPS